jgi:6-phosphogluconolactonase
MSGTSSKGVDRRLFLAAGAAVMAMPMAARAALGDLVYYVGSMGAGATTLSYSPAYDKWTLGKADPSVPNASFGVYSPKLKRHYIVNEQDAGTIGVYQSNSSGKFSKKGEVSSQGKSPCYVSLDATESYLAVANYGSGNIAVYPLDKSGMPGTPVVKQNSGTGKDPERQEGPHAHWVKWSPDGKFIYSVDLGTDELIAWPFDAATGAVGDKIVAFKCEAGYGPRHFLIHPSGQVAYLLGELANAVVTLRPNGDGTFIGTQWTSTLPEGFTDHSQAAHIALNREGNLLYVSNRGHNSIVTWYLDGTGRLGASAFTPCGGDWPRFFTMVPGLDRIVIANQKSGDLNIVRLHSDGTLGDSVLKLTVPAPVFVGANI